MGIRIRRRELIGALVGTAMWPLAVRAQPGKFARVGILWHAGSSQEEQPYYSTLLEAFRRLGYVEGRNVAFEHRFPNETPELFKRLAAELVAMNVDVIVASGNVATPYAKKATTTIPIVFMFVADPIGLKLVDSFAKPGGNATGTSNYSSEVIGRGLQILKETIPGLLRVAQLVNPNAPTAPMHVELTRSAAAELGLAVQIFEAQSLADLGPTFDAIARAGMQAVTVNPEGLAFQGRAIIPKLALARGIALSAYSRETFEPGALMSYGADSLASIRSAVVYADKILKGAQPSELPVEGPTRFEFLINLKTAKALGIEVPPVMLGRADEVIE